MEQKTIGKFIAALRKANGMTQKELAEKLNVSDKTVSRWECDDGAPDLSVIPVIAEIFGVTCDELLRGERKPAAERTAEPEETTAKGEKQRQRLLTMSLSKFRNRSFVSIGISVVGLIAAMICNLGFLRAYIGFFVGAIFYAASLVCQAIFINSAFLSVSDDGLTGPEIDRFKSSVVNLAERSVSVTVILFGVTLPLMVFPYDAYVGLTGSSWFGYGTAYGMIALLLCGTACYFLNAYLLKKGVYSLCEKEEETYWHNHRLKRGCAAALAVILAVTFFAHSFVNNRWNAWALAEGREFHDYESFVEFMETDIQNYNYTDFYVLTEPMEPNDTVYYDEFGNEITEEEALRSEVRISDGTGEGKVVCTYIHRNQTVCSVRPADSGDGLPITVITDFDYEVAQNKVNMINVAFLWLYGLEILGVVLVYWKKRAK